jgi:hypothetical protein
MAECGEYNRIKGRRRGLTPGRDYSHQFCEKEQLMPDPIWLDTNALDNALKGNAAINKQLSEYRRAGRKLLVTQQVETELLFGNFYTLKKGKKFLDQVPKPEFREKMRTGMQKIGVTIDTKWREIPSSQFDNWCSIDTINVSKSDSRVLAEVKASAKARGIANPEMLSGEFFPKAMANTKLTAKWGITVIPTANTFPLAPEVPRVNLADYPEDNEGEVTKHFKDEQVWEKLAEDAGEDKSTLKKAAAVAGKDTPASTKLALAGAGIAAQAVSSHMMSRVFDHFTEAINLAKAEFDALHPDAFQLRAQAGLDRYKQAYETGLMRVNLPSNLKIAEAVALAFTKDSDLTRAKAIWDAQIAKVVSAKDGTISGYGKVAGEYMDAMVKLHDKVYSAAVGVQDIVADIKKRGSVIVAAGEALERTFWKNIVLTLQFPVVYYEWLNVKNTADSLQNLGSTVLSFATYISDRLAAYDIVLKQLEQELQKVSDELNKFN